MNSTIVVTRKNAWETRYKQHLGGYMGAKIKRGEEQKLTAEDDRLARHWASVSVGRDMTPSDEEQEIIARSMNIETYQMKVEAKYRWNRIQKEKIKRMLDLEQKYKKNDIGQGKCLIAQYIEKSIEALNDGLYVLNAFTVMRDMRLPNLGIAKEWELKLDLATKSEEVTEAIRWVNEYDERLIREVLDYIENGVPLPTIDFHYKYSNARHQSVSKIEYDIKYEFRREVSVL